MSWIEEIRHDIDSLPDSPKALRKFGLIIGTVFIVLFGMSMWKGWFGSDTGILLGIIGLLFIGIGIIAPSALRRPHVMWMSIAIILGSLVSRIILSILFFIVMTPIAAIAKVAGKTFFQKHRDGTKETYWITRDTSKHIDYEKMH